MGKTEYVAYLKSQGASDEDVKALAEGAGATIAIRTFDALQATATAEATARAAADKKATDYDEWFNGQLTPQWNQLLAEATKARGNEAKAFETLRELNRRGLIDNAILEGVLPANPANPNPANPNIPGTPGNPTPPARNVADANFDPNKYLTRDEILRIANQEGDAIAMMATIAAEHAQLFPNADLVNWRALRERAVAAKKSVEQQWMEEFKVNDARTARSKAASDAHDAAIAKAERDKVTAEFAAKYGANPDTRIAVPSRSPFVVRPERVTAGAAPAQPWQSTESELSAKRVENATRKSLERTA